jgi:hypothetical protein
MSYDGSLYNPARGDPHRYPLFQSEIHKPWCLLISTLCGSVIFRHRFLLKNRWTLVSFSTSWTLHFGRSRLHATLQPVINRLIPGDRFLFHTEASCGGTILARYPNL